MPIPMAKEVYSFGRKEAEHALLTSQKRGVVVESRCTASSCHELYHATRSLRVEALNAVEGGRGVEEHGGAGGSQGDARSSGPEGSTARSIKTTIVSCDAVLGHFESLALSFEAF